MVNTFTEVQQLTPPLIRVDSIQKKIVCTRPMREGRFNISVEEHPTSKKVLVHCYGHGGSGWTTLFGSIEHAITLFEKRHANKKIPIRVIGAGCMGLTAAIELSRKGYSVLGITTKSIYDNPSWRPAGYFALVSLKTSPDEQIRLNEIGMSTFLSYQQIEKSEHPYIPKEAVRALFVYCDRETSSGLEEFEAKGLIPPKKEVTLDFGNGVSYANYHKYQSYFLDTSLLMKTLSEEIRRLGIPLEIKEIQSFEEVEENVIFNCSGLGARLLNHDEQMIDVRGHLITLNEMAGHEHMHYMIYTTVLQQGKKEYIYLFPKNSSVLPEHPEGIACSGVLGGTFLPNVEKLSPYQQEKLDEQEFAKLLERTAHFFSGRSF